MTTNAIDTNPTLLGVSSGAIDSIPSLATLRDETFRHLQEVGFPGPKNEEYKYTPLTRALEKLSLDDQEGTGTVNLADYAIPDLDATVVAFVNEKCVTSLPETEGLIVKPLQEALSEGKGINHFAKIVDAQSDAFVAWNTLAWTYGFYIEVPAGKTLTKPLVILHVSDGAVRKAARNLIVVGRNAQCTVIQMFASTGKGASYVNVVTEGFVDENARLDLYAIQADMPGQIQFNQTRVLQKDNSRVNSYAFTLGGKLVRNNLALALDGQGCESHMYGLYLLNGDTHADNHTVVDHIKPNSFSNELYKGIMDDTSRGVFNGKIYVRPNAQKTNAFQSNRNILLSTDAKVNTKPQLEIWADDVKCSHGCTTGQIDEDALFYLMARGIPRSTARAMLLYAFAGETIDAVSLPPVQQYLAQRVSQRLQRNDF
ncbi:MAG: Fe-S cluster assembly protein SufD [Bacteroidota bacterium]|jgi:Fe-S cluster assembly protein SufD|nr:MAG: Fe-S cluster assembly protein SufD [Bacteroidota bacterium]